MFIVPTFFLFTVLMVLIMNIVIEKEMNDNIECEEWDGNTHQVYIWELFQGAFNNEYVMKGLITNPRCMQDYPITESSIIYDMKMGIGVYEPMIWYNDGDFKGYRIYKTFTNLNGDRDWMNVTETDQINKKMKLPGLPLDLFLKAEMKKMMASFDMTPDEQDMYDVARNREMDNFGRDKHCWKDNTKNVKQFMRHM